MKNFNFLNTVISLLGIINTILNVIRDEDGILNLDLTSDKFKAVTTTTIFTKKFDFIIDTGNPFIIFNPKIRQLTNISYPDHSSLSAELNCKICHQSACCLNLHFIQASIPVIVASIKNTKIFGVYFQTFYFLLPLHALPGNLNNFSILGVGSTFSSTTNPFGFLNLNEQLRQAKINKVLINSSNQKPQKESLTTLKLHLELNEPHTSFFTFGVLIGNTPLTSYSDYFSHLIQIDSGSSNICINERLIDNFYNIVNNYVVKERIKGVSIHRNRGYIVAEREELKRIKLLIKFITENGSKFEFELKDTFVWMKEIEKYVMFVDKCGGDVSVLVGWSLLRNYKIEFNLRNKVMELEKK